MFLVILSNFFIIRGVREKVRVKLALAIPTILADEIKQTPLLVALKTIKTLSMQLKAVTQYLLNFLLHDFL